MALGRGENRAGRNTLGRASNPIPKGKNYLLVIGIDSYFHGLHPLNNAVADAKAFRDLLWQQYQFEKANTYTLFDKQATEEAILDVFDELGGKLTDEDNLVFYFSGHGEYLKTTNRGYWLPVDAQAGKRSTYLSNNEVVDFISNVAARHVFGVVDSCFSAALFTQRGGMGVKSRLYAMPSRWLLTAGRLEPVADGSLGGHSPFAESLLAKLKYLGKAVWVGDLCREVLHSVQFNTDNQMPRGEPLQGTGHQGGEFVFLRKEIRWDDIENDISIEPAPVADVEKKFVLGDYHRFTCDRVDQSDRFFLARKEYKDKKIQFYYLLGDPKQSHQGLFMRFAYDFEGRLQDYLNPGLAPACKVIKKDNITFDTSRIQEVYKTNIIRSLFTAFNVGVNEQDGILEKNILHVYENSPEMKDLSASDYVLVLLSIDQWEWEPDITPEVTRWFITRFCNTKLPENAPSFFFFFGVSFDEEFPEIEDEVMEIVHQSSYLKALPKLDMVRYRDIASWFARYKIIAEETDQRKEMIKLHFGEDRQKEHFMENVEICLKKIIDRYNEEG